MPTVKELRAMAKTLQVHRPDSMKKSDLVKAIQRAEGNSPCYQGIPDCGQSD